MNAADVTQKRTLALYVRLDSGTPWYTAMAVPYSVVDEHYTPLPDGERRETHYASYTRVSEPQEVSFAPLANDVAAAQAVAALDEQERQAIAELNKKLMEIRGMKAQLLALTHAAASEGEAA